VIEEAGGIGLIGPGVGVMTPPGAGAGRMITGGSTGLGPPQSQPGPATAPGE
jgi:hypothetical protein